MNDLALVYLFAKTKSCKEAYRVAASLFGENLKGYDN